MKTVKGSIAKTVQPSYYNCSKCPAYCCSIYERVQVTKRDLNRLAKYFGVDFETAQRRFTTSWQGERILRRTADPIFGKSCKFLNPETRQCTIYDGRPQVCREFPSALAALITTCCNSSAHSKAMKPFCL